MTDAIAFDFGFTLANHVTPPHLCLHESLAQRGVRIEPQGISDLCPPRLDLAAAFDRWQGSIDTPLWDETFFAYYERWVERLDTGLSRYESAAAAREALSRYQANENWCPMPYSRELLEGCRERGLAVGLLSNWGAGLRELIGEWNWASCFDIVLSAVELGFAKPHRQSFQSLCDRLGVTPPRCLYVGDDPVVDEAGALAAGLRSCLVTRPECGGLLHLLPRAETLAAGG